jgi:hypothetical protein
MAREEFDFDFCEDADPVQELHRLRVAAAKHFKTMKATLEYLRSVPTAEEFLARLDAKAQAKAPKAAQPKSSKTTKKSIGRRKAARHPVS